MSAISNVRQPCYNNDYSPLWRQTVITCKGGRPDEAAAFAAVAALTDDGYASQLVNDHPALIAQSMRFPA